MVDQRVQGILGGYCMKLSKVHKGSILFRKNLYKEHFKHCDCFGSSKDAERRFEYDIEVNKCYALNGVWYEIKMPNCTMHDRKLERLAVQAIEYATDEFPQFFRLIDELKRRGIYRSL